jgi:hypothetical protein
LVLEPIFEADFRSCSYGFRPNRRAQDAVTETWHLASNSYEWVVEGDIEACFDRIGHTALMDRVCHRIADKRVLSLIKAFLKAGILGQGGQIWSGDTGTPQGGILSPLLANVALSVLDEHFDQYTISTVERAKRRRHGLANYRLVRYADDFVIMVSGNRAQAEALLPEVAAVLAPMGFTAVGREDDDHPHRRGAGLPRMAHPASPQEGDSRALRLHLSVEESAPRDHDEGEGGVLAERERIAGRPAAPAESDAAGLDGLLPARSVQCDLRVPAFLCLAPGNAMDPQETPPD